MILAAAAAAARDAFIVQQKASHSDSSMVSPGTGAVDALFLPRPAAAAPDPDGPPPLPPSPSLWVPAALPAACLLNSCDHRRDQEDRESAHRQISLKKCRWTQRAELDPEFHCTTCMTPHVKHKTFTAKPLQSKVSHPAPTAPHSTPSLPAQ